MAQGAGDFDGRDRAAYCDRPDAETVGYAARAAGRRRASRFARTTPPTPNGCSWSSPAPCQLLPPAGQDNRLSVQGLQAGALIEVVTPPPDNPRKKAAKLPANFDFPGQDIVVLRSARNADRSEGAVVFVPDQARNFLRQRMTAYGQVDLGNQRRPDVDRFEAIETVSAASALSLFAAPVDFGAPAQWWELWVREPNIRADAVANLAHAQGIDVHPQRLVFPDTVVVFLHTDALDLAAFAARIPGH